MIKFEGIVTGADVTIQLKDGETVKTSGSVTDWGNTGDVTPPTTVNTPLSGTYTADVYAGRVATLELPDDAITAVSVTSQPSHGRVTVNPDYTLACVLSESLSTATVEFDVSITDGSGTHAETVTLAVAASPQDGGWGLGNFYMLQTDGSDRVIVEPGLTHRKLHISKAGFSAQDIVDREAGLSNTSEVTASYLLNTTASGHSEKYGETEALALDEFAIGLLWEIMNENETSSNWLLFKRGETFNECPQTNTANRYWLCPDGMNGESPRHPILISCYGTGDLPILEDYRIASVDDFDNLVVRDLKLVRSIIQTNGHSNIIYDNVDSDGDFDMTDNGVEFQTGSGGTLRDCKFYNITYSEPQEDPLTWSKSGSDRIQGGFTQAASGLLIERHFVDHNGWGDGYDYDGDPAFPQTTTDRNQGFYTQNNCLDVTIRDSVFMRNAYSGLSLRSGGFVSGCLFVDNILNFYIYNGIYASDGPIGNFSCIVDSVATSGGYRQSDFNKAVAGVGFRNVGYLNTWLRSTVCHAADPNNAVEYAAKKDNRPSAVQGFNRDGYTEFYNDTKIHNWTGALDGWKPPDDESDVTAADRLANDENVDGLNLATMTATTIQKFAESKIDDGVATIADFSTYLKAQGSVGPTVRDAIAFFQNGFGWDAIPTAATTLNFVPSSLAEGVRLDNRLNWSPQQYPKNDDTLNLRGNRVYHDGTLTGIDMDMGAGGYYRVHHGYIQMDSLAVGTGGGTLDVEFVGQVYLDGYTDSDKLTVNVSGNGRFFCTANITGAMDLNISGGQVALVQGGNTFTQNGDITISGGKVGFCDTSGTGTLALGAGTLTFDYNSGAFEPIAEFDKNGDEATSGTFNVTLGGVDVVCTNFPSGTHDLIVCDGLSGSLGTVTSGVEISGNTLRIVV